MFYRVNENMILRDIGGIYFIVDIKRRDYYDRKQITSLNNTMYCLCRIMERLHSFSVEAVTKEFEMLFSLQDDTQLKTLHDDVIKCTSDLIDIGYLEEICDG